MACRPRQPRVVSRDDDSRGPDAAGKQCNPRPRRGVPGHYARTSTTDRGIRGAPVHGPGLRPRGRKPQLAERAWRTESTGRRTLFHRDQRSCGTESDRGSVRCKCLHPVRRVERTAPTGERRCRRGSRGHRPRPGHLQHTPDYLERHCRSQQRDVFQRGDRACVTPPARAPCVTTRRTSAITR
jgi:hypothetical protein